LFLPQICHANMVVGFLTNYPPLFLALSFIAVVVIEAAELKKRLGLPPKKSMIVSLAANAVTSLLGVVGGYLLKADIFKNLTYVFGWLAILFLSSFILEALIMTLFPMPQSKAKIWKASLMMNLISYLFLILFAFLDIIFFSGIIVFAFVIERLFVVFEWGRAWSKSKVLALQLLIFILFFGAAFLLVFVIPQNHTNNKAKDSRVIAAMNQMRKSMIFSCANDGHCDNFRIDNFNDLNNSDLDLLVQDISINSYLGKGLKIVHFPSVNSSAVCIFAQLGSLKGKSWYCADNQGNAGIVDINPSGSAYCSEGQSAICPLIIEPMD